MNYLYRPNQRVRIVGNSTIHHFVPKGDMVTIQDYSFSYHSKEPAYIVSCEATNGRKTQLIVEKDLAPAGARVV